MTNSPSTWTPADVENLRRAYAADLAAQPGRSDAWRYWAGIVARPAMPALPRMRGAAQLAIRQIGRYGWEW